MAAYCVMGNDYYVTSEYRVEADGTVSGCGQIFGYAEITQQYYNRYRLAVMQTETNNLPFNDGALDPVEWLWKQWATILCVRSHGIPILGFTWYSLTDHVDWDTALRESNGKVHPLGLCDLDRNIKPVGEAYRSLIRLWRDRIPNDTPGAPFPIVADAEPKNADFR